VNNEAGKIIEKTKEEKSVPLVSAVLDDGTIVETLRRPGENRTLFCVSKDGQWEEVSDIVIKGIRYRPYSPQNNLLKHEVVLFPSGPEEYGSQETLIEDIQSFIHRYVQVSTAFEELAAHYVLFTWVYDAFNEVPYLRAMGDYGCGKTRFLLTVGSLCYKPIFASGASTVSPLFRILDGFRGTLVVDESDFRYSDEKADLVKILNNGNARGFPVLRSEITASKEINPTAFAVFGPKLVASRGPFQDQALESRFLTEAMGQSPLRDDIPINLPTTFSEEALHLHNQLLLFRLRTSSQQRIHTSASIDTLEPRLRQILLPLLSIVDNTRARQSIARLALGYHLGLLTDRSACAEAQVLEIIRDMLKAGETKLAAGDIARWFADRFGAEYEKKITARWIGYLLRSKLHLKTRKQEGVFVIPIEETAKLSYLLRRYGLAPVENQESLPVDVVDIGNVESATGNAEGS